jgi:D-alanyl-D-alanine carboxypeptidase
LEQFKGLYQSADIPLKIDVRVEGGELVAQATGQSSFPLSAVSSNTFTFDQAGIQMKFFPAEKKMQLTQGGRTYNFEIEK